MKTYPQRDFSTPCLGDAWRLEEQQKQIEISTQWLHTYLQEYDNLLKAIPRDCLKLETLQLKILTEASFLQNQLQDYTTLSHNNKDTFLITDNLIRHAQQLLYAAQNVLRTPIKP